MKKSSITVGLILLLGMAQGAWCSSTKATIVSLTQGEQQAPNGTFDSGTMTVTVSGHSETVTYGRFSSTASIASAVAAKFSLDCNSFVTAHAKGATITFYTRDPSASMGTLSASVAWDSADFPAGASFAMNIPANTPPTITPTFACAPSTIIAGQNLTCTVTLISGAQSAISFSANGSAWTTASPDPTTGIATANAALTTAGTYTIAYSYPGETTSTGTIIPPETGSAHVTVDAQGTTVSGNQVYAFSIKDPNGNSGYQANGNIQNYTDTVNGTWALGYDSLNRLISSTQNPVNASTLYGCWAYDSFGNVLTQTVSTQGITPSSNSPYCQTQGSATSYQGQKSYNASNQITSATWFDAANNTHSGAPGYDPHGAGYMTNDLVNSYLYDADGNVCATQPVGGGSIIGYLYDAEGHRVAKGTLPTLTCDATSLQITATYFIGPDGATMTEIDPSSMGDMWARTEVSAAGQWIATYTPDGIHYPITDWLGTKRVQVNPNNTISANGVEETCTSYPFGDRTLCQSAALDASPRQFTGKERDAESGLDYFGARYFGSSMGRFMSPDDGSDQNPGDPQSWNLYSYGRNNPLINTDPTGRTCQTNSSDGRTYDDGDGKGCATVDIQNNEYLLSGAYDAKVNSWDDDPSYQLAKGVADLTDRDSLFDLAAHGIAGAQIVDGVASIPGAASDGLEWYAARQAASKMNGVRALGEAGEAAANIVKNTERIPSATGTASYRVPDILDHSQKIIGEVKNYTTTTVSLTGQLKDDLAYAQANGYTMVLKVRQGTNLSGPVSQLVQQGTIKLVHF